MKGTERTEREREVERGWAGWLAASRQTWSAVGEEVESATTWGCNAGATDCVDEARRGEATREEWVGLVEKSVWRRRRRRGFLRRGRGGGEGMRWGAALSLCCRTGWWFEGEERDRHTKEVRAATEGEQPIRGGLGACC